MAFYYDGSNFLYHHGVKGMKWGVRRYQNKDGSLTSKGKKRYSEKRNSNDSGYSRGKNFVEKIGSKSYRSCTAGSYETDLLAYYSTMAAVQLAAVFVVKKVIKHRDKKEFNDMYENRDITTLKSAPKLSHKVPPKDSMKKVNPNYPNVGSTMNCTFCTTAMVMREKGYDVIASETNHGWNTKDLYEKTFNSPEIKMPRKTKGKDVLTNLESNGEGSYGNLTVNWKMGGGHSVFWKVEKGKAHIYDGQNGEEITGTPASTSKFMNSINTRNISYNRMDNCEPTEYALSLIHSAKH